MLRHIPLIVTQYAWILLLKLLEQKSNFQILYYHALYNNSINFSHFDWFSSMINKRTDARLTSLLQSFSLCVEKWRKILRFQIILYMIGKKISTKKYCRSIEQVQEAQSSRNKNDKAVSFLENGSEKILKHFAVERD